MNDKQKKILHSLFLIFSGITFGGLVLLPFFASDIDKLVYNNPFVISYFVLWLLISFIAIYYKD